MLQKDKATLTKFDESVQLEWLETNGLGGWASSTIIVQYPPLPWFIGSEYPPSN